MSVLSRRWRAAALLLALAAPARTAPPAPAPACAAPAFGSAAPESEGVDARKLLELTQWVETSTVPILSIAVSRDGQVVYELYTSSLTRDDAHYLMSVTKSVTSALVGVAVDRGFLKGPEQTVAELLPRAVFPDDAAYARFQKVTLKDVLGMSALDAPVPPHEDTPDAWRRLRGFFSSPDRVAFALGQKTLPAPGADFQYTDLTPTLAAAVVQYRARRALLDLANEALFGPMGFAHQEWMHQDAAGVDLGAYGLRLRPLDMQKLGVLYLQRGCWGGRRLLSADWVERSFTPWLRSAPRGALDYGWYWWHYRWPNGWTAHVAAGWKGQRVAVFPEKRVVVTMTGNIDDGTEDGVFGRVLSAYVMPAVDGAPPPREERPALAARLRAALARVQAGASRLKPGTEERMVPSAAPKEGRRPFSPPP
jgi:CubicO group peptidase (beta-lactamase class C family)